MSRPDPARSALRVLRVLAVAALLALSAALTGPVGLVGLTAQPAAAAGRHPLVAARAAGDPTVLALVADRSELPVGRQATLRGRLTDPSTGAALPEAPVRLEALDASTGAWELVSDLVTDGAGDVAATLAPPRTTVYRLHHGDWGGAEESVSAGVRIHLTELTAALERTAVPAGRDVLVSGLLVAAPGSVLRLERLEGRHWVPVDRTRTAADQSYAFTVAPTLPGFWRWRVVSEHPDGSGRLVAAPPRLDAFRLHTYTVETRGAVRVDLTGFRASVAATYADPRGWALAHHRFREVPSGGDLTVVLARAAYLPGFASVCSASYSCQVGRRVVINASRWAHGSRFFTGTLPAYRRYLVDHETGHWLGLGHALCPRPGAPAPVMQQQSKGMQGCRPNSWPLPREVRAVS